MLFGRRLNVEPENVCLSFTGNKLKYISNIVGGIQTKSENWDYTSVNVNIKTFNSPVLSFLLPISEYTIHAK